MTASPTPATERLFSYGTLQLEGVQLSTFGRRLNGHADQLPGYRLGQLEIRDSAVVATSGKTHHLTAWAYVDARDSPRRACNRACNRACKGRPLGDSCLPAQAANHLCNPGASMNPSKRQMLAGGGAARPCLGRGNRCSGARRAGPTRPVRPAPLPRRSSRSSTRTRNGASC